MAEKLRREIHDFNCLFRQYDDIYRRAARTFDLPELALWVLYVIRQIPDCTLKDVCAVICHCKQSVHSAVKYLTAHGYLQPESSAYDHRRRILRLTDAGRLLAERTADLLIAAEQCAFLTLDEEEREIFLRLFRRLTVAMDMEFQKITGACDSGCHTHIRN